MKDRCENCRFWLPEDFPEPPGDIQAVDFGTGLCRRFPPTLSIDTGLEYRYESGDMGKEAFFPITQHNISCGEHKPKEK